MILDYRFHLKSDVDSEMLWFNLKCNFFFAEVEAIFGGKCLEMDLGVQEYLKGEKHQLGRHVTMLLILLVMMIVVST